MEIAYADLSALCHAVGVLNMQDTSQLHNRPFLGTVKLTAGDAQYEPRNEMTAFKKDNAQQAAQPTQFTIPGIPPIPAPVAPIQSASAEPSYAAPVQSAPIPTPEQAAAFAATAAPPAWAQAPAQPWEQAPAAQPVPAPQPVAPAPQETATGAMPSWMVNPPL